MSRALCVLAICLSLAAVVAAQDCYGVLCAPPEDDGCLLTYEIGLCCPICCEDTTVSCFDDPCNGYSCNDDPAWTCFSDFCGACNRIWFDENNTPVVCDDEQFGDSDDIDTSCDSTSDCSLQDVSVLDDCCDGFGECIPNLGEDKWVAVNTESWFANLPPCNQNCGLIPLCPAIYYEPGFGTRCQSGTCRKVSLASSSNSFSSGSPSSGSSSSASSRSSSTSGDSMDSAGTSLLPCVVLLATAVALVVL
mmetsp:Transcript_12165/g.48909  ORF Transcript_12165/g.48909 Transcript_12165/m.48909 type:complete len:249 (+) Transcript_12165:32-778(+)